MINISEVRKRADRQLVGAVRTDETQGFLKKCFECGAVAFSLTEEPDHYDQCPIPLAQDLLEALAEMEFYKRALHRKNHNMINNEDLEVPWCPWCDDPDCKVFHQMDELERITEENKRLREEIDVLKADKRALLGSARQSLDSGVQINIRGQQCPHCRETIWGTP